MRSGLNGGKTSYPNQPAIQPSVPRMAPTPKSQRQSPAFAKTSPRNGPIAIAPNRPMLTKPDVSGSFDGGNRRISGGSAPTSSSPVAMPCRIRPATKTEVSGANADSSAATTNPASYVRNSRRCTSFWARNAATTAPSAYPALAKPEPIWSVVADACRSFAIRPVTESVATVRMMNGERPSTDRATASAYGEKTRWCQCCTGSGAAARSLASVCSTVGAVIGCPQPACRLATQPARCPFRSAARCDRGHGQSRVSLRWVMRCGRAASGPSRSILLAS